MFYTTNHCMKPLFCTTYFIVFACTDLLVLIPLLMKFKKYIYILKLLALIKSCKYLTTKHRCTLQQKGNFPNVAEKLSTSTNYFPQHLKVAQVAKTRQRLCNHAYWKHAFSNKNLEIRRRRKKLKQIVLFDFFSYIIIISWFSRCAHWAMTNEQEPIVASQAQYVLNVSIQICSIM